MKTESPIGIPDGAFLILLLVVAAIFTAAIAAGLIVPGRSLLGVTPVAEQERGPAEGGQPPRLFRSLTEKELRDSFPSGIEAHIQTLQNSAWVRRSRPVEVRLDLISRGAATRFLALEASPSRTLRIALDFFEDFHAVAVLRRVAVSKDERTVVWTGMLEDHLDSEVVLATTAEVMMGSVTTSSGMTFQIRPVGDSRAHLIQEINQKEYPPDLPPKPPRQKAPGAKVAARDEPPGQDDGSRIDVLVVYTPAVIKAMGSENAVRTMIDQAEAMANLGYENSVVIQRIRVVHKAQVPYDESGGFDKALEHLATPGDGYLDEVQPLRDRYGADMVSLWINNADACGLAYLLKDLSRDFSEDAFSVVFYDCVVGNYSFAHEMAHNQGAEHDKENAEQGLFPYSLGFQQKARESFFRTIMAYKCADQDCPRINRWSNPNAKYQGIATGEIETDNHKTLDQTRAVVSRWRKSRP